MDDTPLKILWADDESSLLKPYFIFLEQKNYTVIPANDGNEALDILEKDTIDIIFLDENMPGLSGLETLQKIKNLYQSIPVVMITKSEEEYIMEEAIGNHISDYLIKPVNPNQILLTLKKNIDHSKLISEKSAQKYQQEFRDISMNLSSSLSFKEWIDVYKTLTYWDVELSNSNNSDMKEILESQQIEANQLFSKFVANNYGDWMNQGKEAPDLSHNVFSRHIKPLISETESPLFVLLIDNLRWDHWFVIKSLFSQHFRIKQESIYCSILPTTTQYSRNAFFSGMTPREIQRKFPDKWFDESDAESKNNYEKDFLADWLNTNQIDSAFSYHKVLNSDFGNKLAKKIPNLFSNPLNVIIYNFVDMLSHAGTDVSVVKEMSHNNNAYRNTVKNWVKDSSLTRVLEKIAEKKGRLIITTDHGSIQIKKPIKIQSTKDTNFNLRYKSSKIISFEDKSIFEVTDPTSIGLPTRGINHKYIFGTNDDFLVYPTEYQKYVDLYSNTYQHGGISLEEMLIPLVYLEPK